jgi:hypothetical protein
MSAHQKIVGKLSSCWRLPLKIRITTKVFSHIKSWMPSPDRFSSPTIPISSNASVFDLND